ncbi:MAG TPA: hypothetical protein VNL77_02785 [Roseiflexaceae bacterium]|nr:hypothetical protein [Roseiflexaceae bacterium]
MQPSRTLRRAPLILVLAALLGACGTPDERPAAGPTGSPVAAAGTRSLDPTALPPEPSPTPLPPPTAVEEPAPATPTPAPELPTPEPGLLPPSPTPLPAPALPPALIYQRPNGSLWRADGASPPVQLDAAAPLDASRTTPWAAAPDGATVAFVTSTGVYGPPGDTPPAIALWLVGADGTNARAAQSLLPPDGIDLTPGSEDAFTLLPALIEDQRLAWSPRGDQVLFVSAHEGQVDLYTAGVDGSVTRLTDTPALETGPVWSPDGSLVAFRFASGFGTGAGWSGAGLAVIPPAGGAPLLSVSEPPLANGDTTTYIGELLWAGGDTLVATLESPPVGGSEVRAYIVSSGQSLPLVSVTRGMLGGVAWNGTYGVLAIAVERADTPEDPGLFSWRPGESAAVRIDDDPAAWPAWAEDALAYSAVPEDGSRGVRIWNLGADGDIRQVSLEPAHMPAWSVDGQVLAAGDTLYTREGQVVAVLPGEGVIPLGWTPRGLFFTRLDETLSGRELWLWDGTQANRVDALHERYELAQVTP